jgi:hypothetical protein
MLKHQISLILHGHVHNNLNYRHNDLSFLNGGASIEGSKDGMCLNLVFVNSRQQIDCRIQRFQEEHPVYEIISDHISLIPKFAG